MDINKAVAVNLVRLRKKNNLTQNDVAIKLNYSDNTVSRWEHGEITPSLETLARIAELYGVPVETLLKEDAVGFAENENKVNRLKSIATMLLCVSQVWFIAAVLFFYSQTFTDFLPFPPWKIFVWAVPASCMVVLIMTRKWKKRIWNYVFQTIFIWSLITAFYLQFIEYNMYLIYIVGVAPQVSISILTFVRKK